MEHERHNTGWQAWLDKRRQFIRSRDIVGLVFAGLVWAFGGVPMLLEVAFEVAFAGTVVRKVTGEVIHAGRWHVALLQTTWKAALLLFLFTLGVAAYLQHSVPQAVKLSEAIQVWRSR